MTEAKFQAKFLKRLRAHGALAQAVIFKHTDFRTGGIPDCSVTLGHYTTWLEFKVFPNKLSKLQAFYMKKLDSFVVTLQQNNVVEISDMFGRTQLVNFNEAVEYVVELCVVANAR